MPVTATPSRKAPPGPPVDAAALHEQDAVWVDTPARLATTKGRTDTTPPKRLKRD